MFFASTARSPSLLAMFCAVVRAAVDAGLGRRVRHADAEAAEARRVVAHLGRVVAVEQEDNRGCGDHRVRAVDTARAGRDRLAADHAVVDHAVLVAHAQLAPAAAQEQPGLVGVGRAVGVCLELDRRTVLEAGLLGLGAREHVDLGVVAEVEAAAQVGIQLQIILLAAERLGAQEAGDRDVERAAGLDLGRVGRGGERHHAGPDQGGRPQQNVPHAHADAPLLTGSVTVTTRVDRRGDGPAHAQGLAALVDGHVAGSPIREPGCSWAIEVSVASWAFSPARTRAATLSAPARPAPAPRNACRGGSSPARTFRSGCGCGRPRARSRPAPRPCPARS